MYSTKVRNQRQAPIQRGIMMDPFFRTLFSENRFENKQMRFKRTTPAVNITENEKQYQIELAAPGLSKNDFAIDIDKYTLKVVVNKSKNSEEKDTTENQNYKLKEFSFSDFTKSFTLPKEVNMDEISANYEKGVLTILIPKKEVFNKRINIA